MTKKKRGLLLCVVLAVLICGGFWAMCPFIGITAVQQWVFGALQKLEVVGELPLDKAEAEKIHGLFSSIRETAEQLLNKEGGDYSVKLGMGGMMRYLPGKKQVKTQYEVSEDGVGGHSLVMVILENGDVRIEGATFSGPVVSGRWLTPEEAMPSHAEMVREIRSSDRASAVISEASNQFDIGSMVKWPVNMEKYEAIKEEADRLMNLYASEFNKQLRGSANTDISLKEIKYTVWDGKEGRAEITIRFNAPVNSIVGPGATMRYKDGKMHLQRVNHMGIGQDDGHIGYASHSALEKAIAVWQETAEADSILARRDKKSDSGSGWKRVSGDLPGGLGKITLIRKGAHPFLAEYDRKIELDLPGMEPQTLSLPMNTGGRTCIQVFLIEQGEERFVRLAGSSLDMVISLEDFRFCDRAKYPEGKFVGAFMAVVSPLKYVDVNKDRAGARKHFERAAKRQYRTGPLESLNKLEKEEAGGN